ncbi:MAG: sensor domain-containing diguanylate cyclase [Actinomycetota bacterium]
MRLVERGVSRGRRRLGPPGAAWALLIVGIAVSLQITHLWNGMIATDQRNRFEQRSMDFERQLSQEFVRYDDAIGALGHLYAASDHMTPAAFDADVLTLDVQARYPGIEDITFLRPSDPADLPMEPSARRWSRESGLPAVIRSYTVERFTRTPEDGFIVYAPVLSATDGGKDAGFLGWIEARIDTENMLQSLFEYGDVSLGFAIYDGDVIDPVRRVGTWPSDADADRGTLATSDTFRAFDRQWTLQVHDLPGFIDASERRSPTLILFGTLAITLFVFVLIWSLSRSRARAFRAVDQATAALKEREQMLAHQATHDMLTGLPNRRLLTDRLEVALARAPRRDTGVALLFIDLDRFKDINDALGHDVGDLVLTETAGRLRRTVRPSDTVARLGGDEFVILCDDVSGVTEVEQIATRVRGAMAEPIRHRDGSVVATGSIGIVFQPDGLPADPEAILRRADEAMYGVKHHGRDGFALAEPIPA